VTKELRESEEKQEAREAAVESRGGGLFHPSKNSAPLQPPVEGLRSDREEAEAADAAAALDAELEAEAGWEDAEAEPVEKSAPAPEDGVVGWAIRLAEHFGL
jgi:hypothetical protein